MQNRVDAHVRDELLKLQKRARDKRHWEQVFLKESDIIRTVNHWLPTTNSLLLAEALKNDLRILPLHEAVASWCNPDTGLGNQFPLQILDIARKILPEEQAEDGPTHYDQSD